MKIIRIARIIMTVLAVIAFLVMMTVMALTPFNIELMKWVFFFFVIWFETAVLSMGLMLIE